jgi:transcription initiation factor TFIIA small subunit
MTNYEIYRRSTIGLALTDALDELIQNQQLSPPLAMKVLYQFDRTMTEVLNNKMRVRGSIKVGICA